MFVVDSSRGVNWPQMKSFTKWLLRYFDISPRGTHVAYVVYADGANLRFSFPLNLRPGMRYNVEDVRKSIDGVGRATGTQRNVQLGLQLAQQGFGTRFGGRPGAKKV